MAAQKPLSLDAAGLGDKGTVLLSPFFGDRDSFVAPPLFVTPPFFVTNENLSAVTKFVPQILCHKRYSFVCDMVFLILFLSQT